MSDEQTCETEGTAPRPQRFSRVRLELAALCAEVIGVVAVVFTLVFLALQIGTDEIAE